MWTNIVRTIKKRFERLTSHPVDVSMLAHAVQPLLMVVAITILSFLVVDIFYKGVSLFLAARPMVGKSQVCAAVSPSGQGHPAQYYDGITQRNLFQTTLKAIVDKNAGGSLRPNEEYTAFDLKGTIAVNDTFGFVVVEEKGKGKQKLYRLGELIGSARLVRIGRNTAFLKSGEKEFVMKIKDITEGTLMGRSAHPGGSGIVLSKQEVTDSLGDLKSIMSQAVVRPYLNDGVQQGYVVSNIVQGSLYERLGLKNGDVITDVNNKNLESADDLLKLVNLMQAGGGVTVNLMRNGKYETINYSFH